MQISTQFHTSNWLRPNSFASALARLRTESENATFTAENIVITSNSDPDPVLD